MIRRHIYACILLILTATLMMPVYGAEDYSDVNPSNWAYSYIQNMSDMGIIKGYEDGSFRPDRQVTYAEFIKMIYIAQYCTELEQPDSGHWAMNYYADGMRAGIYTGNDVKTSDLDEVIPREKMALMAANSISPEQKRGTEWKKILESIDDVDNESGYSYEIAVSYSEGILNGYPDGSFRPESGLSRAEAAAVIYRYIEKYGEDVPAAGKAGNYPVKNRDYDADYYDTVLGYNGIEKFVYSPSSECIGVYSDRIQDITLFSDGKKAMPVVNENGEYWEEDGYYVYVFDVKDLYNSESELGIAFGVYIEEIFLFKDALQ